MPVPCLKLKTPVGLLEGGEDWSAGGGGGGRHATNVSQGFLPDLVRISPIQCAIQ